MAISPSGKHLLLVAGNKDHNVAVYDTVSGACVAESKGPVDMVTSVAWEDDQTFAMVGAKLFYQFTINAKSFTKKRGNFGGHDQRIACAVFNGKTCLTGAISGELYQWNGGAIVGAPKKLHARLIDAITVTDTHIFTGARDSKITVMTK
jgi:WD40 repeat protein